MAIHHDLSYQINTVEWDGKVIRNLPMDAICKTLDMFTQMDIKGVMVSGYHLDENSSFDIDKETRRLGAEIAKRGLKVAQHHGLSSTYAPFDSPQDEAIEHLKRSVDFTANLGAEALVLHSGRITGRHVGCAPYFKLYEEQVQEHGLDSIVKLCAENLHMAGEYAKNRGVRIAMENLDRFEPMGSMKILPEIVRNADSDNVGFCIDSGHAWVAGNSPAEWIQIAGDKLFTTHFHDNHGQDKTTLPGDSLIEPHGVDEHLPPGFGTIDWRSIILALQKVHYSYMVNFESGAWPDLSCLEGFRAAIRYWRQTEKFTEKFLLSGKKQKQEA